MENISAVHKLDALYFNSLEYKQQLLYNVILSSTKNFDEYTKTLPYKYTKAEFFQTVNYLIADNPEIFYLDFDKTQTYVKEHKTRVKLSYIDTPEKIQLMKTELEEAVSLALETVQDKKDDFEIELALHDYLVNNCYYSQEVINNTNFLYNTVYGALVDKIAFCDGYALALKLLLDKKDIYCCVVYGITDNVNHAWNMVYIDDKFYHVDATWNDAEIEFIEELKFHGYFNLNDDMIKVDHTISNPDVIPTASQENTYYMQKKLYVNNLMEFDRIAYREILGAGYQSKNYIEIYVEFTRNGDDLKDAMIKVIQRINTVQSDFKLKEVYRAFNASLTNNSMTIQLFYED